MLHDRVGVLPSVLDPQKIRESPWNIGISNITTRMETQRQTNGDVIKVSGQKPTLDNSIDMDRIACYA